MKKLSLFIAVLLVATAFLPNLHAAGKPAPKPRATPAHTTITSVSETSITVQEAKASKTFTVTKDTEILFKGQRVPISQLQAGMRVEITSGTTPGVAARINASDAPKAPAAKK